MSLDGGKIIGNRVNDTYSILIYLDNSRNVLVDRNYLTSSNPTYFRSGFPARGIEISAESCCVPNPNYISENITISNNLVVNTRSAFRYWKGDAGGTYSNLKILFNTFVSSVGDDIINMDSANTQGNEFKNNIIHGKANIPNYANWTFSNNLWVGKKPAIDTSLTSFETTDPRYLSPELMGSAQGYALQSTSPAINKGMAIPEVVTDFIGHSRNQIPSIGAFEFGSTNVPANSVLSIPSPAASQITTAKPSPTPTSTRNTTRRTIRKATPTLSLSGGPSIKVSSPVTNYVVPSGGVWIGSTVTDSDGIYQTNFYVDNYLVKTCPADQAVCNYTYRGFLNTGQHQIKIEAIDKSVNRNKSQSIINVIK